MAEFTKDVIKLVYFFSRPIMPIKVCILARWKARNVIKKSCESEFRFCNRHPLVSPAYCRYPRFFGPPVPAAPSGATKCPLRSAFSLDPSSTCLPRVRKGDLCCGAGVRGGARGCAGVLGAGKGLILLDFGRGGAAAISRSET